MIPYGRQDINESDIQAVLEVLRSDFLTQGPVVPTFEKAVSDYCGANYAVAVNSATSALHIACLALGVGKGDIVWTSPITFVASANCAIYCGADVDFVDINPVTYNMSVDELSKKLEQAAEMGKLPKVVIPVHFAGQSCEMKKIYDLSLKYGFNIIEDASHAIGGKYANQEIGSCRYSDIVIFSFHPVKIITTGEGGMALTNNRELAKKMFLLRSHGITRDEALMHHEFEGPWYYEQISLGYNYRMTEMQAALGESQMHGLDEFVDRRHQLSRRYDQSLINLPVTLPWAISESYSAVHLYVIRLKLNDLKKTRLQVFEELRANYIAVNVHYIPIHTQPYYRSMGFKPGQFPQSEKYYSEAISLPMFSAMTESQQDNVISALQKVLQ